MNILNLEKSKLNKLKSLVRQRKFVYIAVAVFTLSYIAIFTMIINDANKDIDIDINRDAPIISYAVSNQTCKNNFNLYTSTNLEFSVCAPKEFEFLELDNQVIAVPDKSGSDKITISLLNNEEFNNITKKYSNVRTYSENRQLGYQTTHVYVFEDLKYLRSMYMVRGDLSYELTLQTSIKSTSRRIIDSYYELVENFKPNIVPSERILAMYKELNTPKTTNQNTQVKNDIAYEQFNYESYDSSNTIITLSPRGQYILFTDMTTSKTTGLKIDLPNPIIHSMEKINEFTIGLYTVVDNRNAIYTFDIRSGMLTEKLKVNEYITDIDFSSEDKFAFITQGESEYAYKLYKNGVISLLEDLSEGNSFGREWLETDAREVEFSPDGKNVLFITTSAPSVEHLYDIWIFNTENLSRKIVENATHPSWANNTTIIYKECVDCMYSNEGGIRIYDLDDDSSWEVIPATKNALNPIMANETEIIYDDYEKFEIWSYNIQTNTSEVLFPSSYGATKIGRNIILYAEIEDCENKCDGPMDYIINSYKFFDLGSKKEVFSVGSQDSFLEQLSLWPSVVYMGD